MKKSIKQTIFVIVGLAVVASVFLFTKSNPVEAAKKNGAKFGDWEVVCTPADPKTTPEPICFLVQQVTSTKDEKTEVLAVYQVGYFPPKKSLQMVQTVPSGIRIEPGTSIISSKKLIAPGKYSICNISGCQAAAEISSSDLKSMLETNDNAVAFMNSENKQVTFPLSVKGLEEGLAFLKE